MLLLFPSCSGKSKAIGEAITERDSLPMMSTLGVTTLISDSGVTRYRVNTEEWQVFDRKKPSYWAFEKGGLGGMNLIACVDSNWAISNKGEILVSIPADKKLFKELTDGKVVVGDRRTMESIPGGTTLGGRTNIILTSDQNYSYGNAKIVHDMDEAMEELKNYADEDIFVVGGEKVYKEFFPYCERAYITKVDYEYQADAYLENLEESDEWIMTHDSDEWTYYDLEYYFYQYKRR